MHLLIRIAKALTQLVPWPQAVGSYGDGSSADCTCRLSSAVSPPHLATLLHSPE